eukprot:g50676.t1
MIFQEIVRFKQSDRHHFCVLLYRPEVPIHADLSTSMICPPDSKWAAPTAILFNQAKIRQQVLTTTKDGMFWGPSTRSAAQQAANLRLFHRTQASEECPGTYPRYHIASIKTARQSWFLLIDPQRTNGFLDHVSAMERKILGGSIDQVAPEYRRVVAQRRTPDRPPIGFDYRGDFQWLNQGFWHCGMITQIAHYPEYRPEDPSDDYPHIGRVGEVPDPAVQGGRLVIPQGPKPFPKVPMHPDLGKQPQAAPNPRPDPATTKGNDPSPPEIPEATASLKEPTTSQNRNLPQPEIPPAKGIEAPATPPSTHPSLPTGSLRKTTSPAQPSAPHIFEGVTRKSRSKSPPTVRADSDDEIDLEHLINDEAEGWRLEQEEKCQQSRNTPPPPTTPTPDKCKEQQTRASVDTPPGMSNQAPPLPISTTSQVDQGNGGGSSPPTRPGTQITPTHQTQNTSSPLGDQGDERPPHPDATSSAGAPRDKQPPIRLTLTRTQRDTRETKMSQEDSKNPLGSGTSHPPPQHAPPPGRTYNPIPEIGSKITQILKLRADFGEHRQFLLTNHILSPPGPQDISRQITRFLRQRSYYKHVLSPLLLTSPRRQWTLLILSKTLKRELVGTTFGQTPSLRSVPSRNNPLIIWLYPNTYQLQGPTLPIQQEVKDWISALGTAEVIHKKVELGVVAGPLNHTAGTEEDTIELHVKTFLSSPSGYQAWIQPRDRATPNPPQNPTAQGTRPPTDRPACQLTTGGHAVYSDPGRPHTPCRKPISPDHRSPSSSSWANSPISTLLQNPLIQLGYDQISQIKTIAAASAKANTVGTPSWERNIWATQQDWKTLLVLPDNLPGAQWPPTPPLHLQWAAKIIWAALTVPPTTTTIPALQEAPPPIQRPPAPRQASNPVTPIPVQHTKRAMKRYRQRMKMKAKRAKLTHAVEVPPTTGPAKGEQPPPTKPKQQPHPTPSPASLTLQQGKQKNPQAPPRQIALTAAKPQKPTQTPRTAKSKAPSNTKKGPPPKAVVKSEPATQLKTHRQAPAPLLSTKQGPPVKRVSFTTQRSPLEDPSDSTSSSSSSEDADESEEEKNQSEEKGDDNQSESEREENQDASEGVDQSEGEENQSEAALGAQDETDSTAEGDEGSPKRDGKDQNAEVLQATLHPPPRIVTVRRRKIHISSEFTPAARDHEPQRTMRLPTPSHRQPPGKGGKPLGPKRQQPPREPHVDIHTQVGGKRKSTATTQPSKQPLPTGNTCNRRGIHNPGTMCWIITTMQALASTRDLPKQTVQAWTRQQRLPQSGSPQHTLHLISNTLTTLTPKRGMGTGAPLRVPWLGDATALSHLHPTFKPGHPGTIHKAIKGIHALLRMIEDQDGSNIISKWQCQITSSSQCYACGGSTSSERIDPIIELHTPQDRPLPGSQLSLESLLQHWRRRQDDRKCSRCSHTLETEQSLMNRPLTLWFAITHTNPGQHPLPQRDKVIKDLPPPRLTIPEKLWVKPDSWGGKGQHGYTLDGAICRRSAPDQELPHLVFLTPQPDGTWICLDDTKLSILPAKQGWGFIGKHGTVLVYNQIKPPNPPWRLSPPSPLPTQPTHYHIKTSATPTQYVKEIPNTGTTASP